MRPIPYDQGIRRRRTPVPCPAGAGVTAGREYAQGGAKDLGGWGVRFACDQVSRWELGQCVEADSAKITTSDLRPAGRTIERSRCRRPSPQRLQLDAFSFPVKATRPGFFLILSLYDTFGSFARHKKEMDSADGASSPPLVGNGEKGDEYSSRSTYTIYIFRRH